MRSSFILVLILLLNGIEGVAQQAKVSSTNLPFNDDTSKLQFVIISDIWGGRRPGIFEDAVEKIQLLQPQFVISVGDLIDGKTYDSLSVERQWNEFNSDISSLTMPFFYVPGNHDLGNPMMEREWRKRIGSPYYHFVYKNVLFLSVNTEDGGRGGIRDAQVNYFKNVLAENQHVRWTFLFMHRPVWQGKGDHQEGYEKIEALLKGRNYTLFSGHHHTYLSANKNGNKHFVLGSTGGGSDLRGENFGEFDHLTMVTFTTGEPKVVNLKLNGIIKENVVSQESNTITQTLINEDWLRPVPFVSEYQFENSVATEVVFNNPTAYPLQVHGKLADYAGCRFIPDSIGLTIAPGQKLVQPLMIKKRDNSNIDLSQLPFIPVSLEGKYFYNNIQYELPANKKLLLSWKRVVADTAGLIAVREPEYLAGPWYWSGAEDNLIQFKVARRGKLIIVTAVITDDQWVNGADGDQLYLYYEDANGGQNLITLPASKEMEIKLPLDKIVKKDHSIRLNIGYRDQDNLPEKQVSTMFWKPLWNSPENYKNSGTFIIQ